MVSHTSPGAKIIAGHLDLSGPKELGPKENLIGYILRPAVAYQHVQLDPITGRDPGKTLWGKENNICSYLRSVH